MDTISMAVLGSSPTFDNLLTPLSFEKTKVTKMILSKRLAQMYMEWKFKNLFFRCSYLTIDFLKVLLKCSTQIFNGEVDELLSTSV